MADSEVLTVVAAGVGGAIALCGSFVTSLMTSRSEERRMLFERSREAQAKVELHMAEVLRYVFDVEYLVFQVAWLANGSPEMLDRDHADKYEKQMSTLMPQLSGAMVVLAGLAPAVHREILPWVEDLWAIESRTEQVLRLIEKEPDRVKELAPYYEELKGFYGAAPERVAGAYRILAAMSGRA